MSTKKNFIPNEAEEQVKMPLMLVNQM